MRALLDMNLPPRLAGLLTVHGIEIALAREKVEKTLLTKEQVILWINKFQDGDIENKEYQMSTAAW